MTNTTGASIKVATKLLSFGELDHEGNVSFGRQRVGEVHCCRQKSLFSCTPTESSFSSSDSGGDDNGIENVSLAIPSIVEVSNDHAESVLMVSVTLSMLPFFSLLVPQVWTSTSAHGKTHS